jgi:hypothetical protein
LFNWWGSVDAEVGYEVSEIRPSLLINVWSWSVCNCKNMLRGKRGPKKDL